MSAAGSSLRVAFRADASIEIGTGHVMRCLTLAAELQARGALCAFLCRAHEGHLIDLIREAGHEVMELPASKRGPTGEAGDPPHAHWLGTGWAEDAKDSLRALDAQGLAGKCDWLIVDHYALDARWERAMRPACDRLMVIDDLADRPHDCDLLLDQSLGRISEDYAGLLSVETDTLLGPRFALMRPEFADLRDRSMQRRRSPKLKRILVFMGGMDKDNATTGVLDVLDTLPGLDGVEISTVLGPAAPWLGEVRARVAHMRHSTDLLVGVSDMARLMLENDLAIGSGGTSSWERCCLGLPSFLLMIAQNQNKVVQSLNDAGAAIGIAQLSDELWTDQLAQAVGRVLQAEDVLERVSAAASAICDGRGAVRTAEALMAGLGANILAAGLGQE